MAVLRIDATCRLSGRADVEPVWNIDVHILIRIFGNARTDDREVFFLLAPRRMRIDKRCRARSKVHISDQTAGDFFLCPFCRDHFGVASARDFTGTNCTSNAKSLQDNANFPQSTGKIENVPRRTCQKYEIISKTGVCGLIAFGVPKVLQLR